MLASSPGSPPRELYAGSKGQKTIMHALRSESLGTRLKVEEMN